MTTRFSGYDTSTPEARDWLERDHARMQGRDEAAAQYGYSPLFPSGDASVPNERGDDIVASHDPHKYDDRLTPEVRGLLMDGGYVLDRGTAHRGVLHPDEYVDHDALIGAVEEQLGFAFDEIRSIYAREAPVGSPLPKELRALRRQLDDRMLELHVDGANMDLLRSILGLEKNALVRAVARAKKRASA